MATNITDNVHKVSLLGYKLPDRFSDKCNYFKRVFIKELEGELKGESFSVGNFSVSFKKNKIEVFLISPYFSSSNNFFKANFKNACGLVLNRATYLANEKYGRAEVG